MSDGEHCLMEVYANLPVVVAAGIGVGVKVQKSLPL